MDTFAQRIRKLRELRGYTQKELAKRAGMNEITIQFYEYGTRNPKPEQVQKLADALLVHVNFLRDSVVNTPDVLVYQLLEEFGDIKFEQNGHTVLTAVPSMGYSSWAFNDMLFDIKEAKDSGLTNDQLKLWLLNRCFANLSWGDKKLYPELKVEPKAGTIPLPQEPTYQDKFSAVMYTEKEIEKLVDLACHEILLNNSNEDNKKIAAELLNKVRSLVDTDKQKFD